MSRLLIEKGANLEDTQTSWTPLHKAIHHGYTEQFVEALTAVGADMETHINKPSRVGLTSIHLCGLWDSPAGLKVLIKALYNAKANIKGSVNMTDKRGKTPLHYAASCGSNAEMIDILLKAGAEIMTDRHGLTPLHAVTHNRANSKSVAEALIRAKVPVDQHNRGGSTALHSAVWHGNPNVTKVLLDETLRAGICVKSILTQINESGGTLLHDVVRYQNNSVLVKTLIEAGADVRVTSGCGNTLLHYAAQQGCVEVFKELIKPFKITRRGLQIALNRANSQGETPLDNACKWGHKYMASAIQKEIKR